MGGRVGGGGGEGKGGGSRACSLPPNWKILKVETNLTCAVRGILEVNLKKSSTLKFMMNISFVPSIFIHRSIILIFMEEKYSCWFFPPTKNIFSPRFSIFISARILVSVTNSRLSMMLLLMRNSLPCVLALVITVQAPATKRQMHHWENVFEKHLMIKKLSTYFCFVLTFFSTKYLDM